MFQSIHMTHVKTDEIGIPGPIEGKTLGENPREWFWKGVSTCTQAFLEHSSRATEFSFRMTPLHSSAGEELLRL